MDDMNDPHTYNDALLIKQWLIQRKVKDAPGSHPLMDAANRILTRLCHPAPTTLLQAVDTIALHLRTQGYVEAIISQNGGVTFRFLNSFDNNFTAEDVRLLEKEIERAHQFLDECRIGGDGTEPLVDRIWAALAAAHGRTSD
jgi:hypothetical protein